jgi:hypothetical protein
LRTAKQVWLATDCDREGQLIGQEILEHYEYRCQVMRVLSDQIYNLSLTRTATFNLTGKKIRDRGLWHVCEFTRQMMPYYSGIGLKDAGCAEASFTTQSGPKICSR